jgi:predicted DNA-binding WGR domain protein
MPYYELVEGTSSKFWEITLEGSSFKTRYGKIGSAGQTTLKEFASADQAKKEYEKLVLEKTKKGYLLKAGDGAPATKSVAKAEKAPAKAPETPKETVKKAVKTGVRFEPKQPAPAPASSAAADDGETRYEFVEGTSSKFWAIRRDGTTVVTRYGKIGTDGQSTEKDFATDALAQKEYDKLVHEKTKKGYVLAGGGDDDGDETDDSEE